MSAIVPRWQWFFKACSPCDEQPAPAALLHSPSACLNLQPAGRNLMFFNWEHGPLARPARRHSIWFISVICYAGLQTFCSARATCFCNEMMY